MKYLKYSRVSGFLTFGINGFLLPYDTTCRKYGRVKSSTVCITVIIDGYD
jgi:hypothetical protein